LQSLYWYWIAIYLVSSCSWSWHLGDYVRFYKGKSRIYDILIYYATNKWYSLQGIKSSILCGFVCSAISLRYITWNRFVVIAWSMADCINISVVFKMFLLCSGKLSSDRYYRYLQILHGFDELLSSITISHILSSLSDSNALWCAVGTCWMPDILYNLYWSNFGISGLSS